MSINLNEIWLLVKQEIIYNKVLLIFAIVLMPAVFVFANIITLQFTLDEPVYFISPIIIIAAISMAIWGNRIKEYRDRVNVLLPLSASNLSIGRSLTYLLILFILFVPHLIFSKFVYTNAIALTSDAYNDFGIIITLLGLSFIIQDFRYVIKPRHNRWWVFFSIILIVILATPIVFFINVHFLELLPSIDDFFKSLFVKTYGLILIAASTVLFYKRKSYTQ